MDSINFSNWFGEICFDNIISGRKFSEKSSGGFIEGEISALGCVFTKWSALSGCVHKLQNILHTIHINNDWDPKIMACKFAKSGSIVCQLVFFVGDHDTAAKVQQDSAIVWWQYQNVIIGAIPLCSPNLNIVGEMQVVYSQNFKMIYNFSDQIWLRTDAGCFFYIRWSSNWYVIHKYSHYNILWIKCYWWRYFLIKICFDLQLQKTGPIN